MIVYHDEITGRVIPERRDSALEIAKACGLESLLPSCDLANVDEAMDFSFTPSLAVNSQGWFVRQHMIVGRVIEIRTTYDGHTAKLTLVTDKRTRKAATYYQITFEINYQEYPAAGTPELVIGKGRPLLGLWHLALTKRHCDPIKIGVNQADIKLLVPEE